MKNHPPTHTHAHAVNPLLSLTELILGWPWPLRSVRCYFWPWCTALWVCQSRRLLSNETMDLTFSKWHQTAPPEHSKHIHRRQTLDNHARKMSPTNNVWTCWACLYSPSRDVLRSRTERVTQSLVNGLHECASSERGASHPQRFIKQIILLLKYDWMRRILY